MFCSFAVSAATNKPFLPLDSKPSSIQAWVLRILSENGKMGSNGPSYTADFQACLTTINQPRLAPAACCTTRRLLCHLPRIVDDLPLMFFFRQDAPVALAA